MTGSSAARGTQRTHPGQAPPLLAASPDPRRSPTADAAPGKDPDCGPGSVNPEGGRVVPAGFGAIGWDSWAVWGDSAALGPLRLGYLPVGVPGGQPSSSQHGVGQRACAQQDEADGQGGEYEGQHRQGPYLRQLERRPAGELASRIHSHHHRVASPGARRRGNGAVIAIARCAGSLRCSASADGRAVASRSALRPPVGVRGKGRWMCWRTVPTFAAGLLATLVISLLVSSAVPRGRPGQLGRHRPDGAVVGGGVAARRGGAGSCRWP